MGIDDHMPRNARSRIMEPTTCKPVVILTGMWDEKLQHVIDEMVKLSGPVHRFRTDRLQQN